MSKRTRSLAHPVGTLAVVTEHQRPGLTERGLAVVHAIRLREACRELDAADREYVAPMIAEILVDVCTDVAAPPRTA